MAKERIHSVDIVKGIAIVAIVVGHVGFYDAAGRNVTEPWLYPFHVPVFFIVAGYFLNTKRSLREFIIQKALRLLVPYTVVSALIIVYTGVLQLACNGSTWPSTFNNVYDAILAALYGTGSWYTPTPFDIAPIGAIWFLPALFFALVIGRVCLQWRFGWIATVVLAIFAFATSRVFWLPLSIQSACVGSVFIMIGVFLRSKDFLTRSIDWLVVLVCTCLYIIAGLYDLKLSLASLLSATQAPGAFALDTGSSILVLYVAKALDDHRETLNGITNRVCNFFEYFGKGSLVVLCVHLFIIDIGVNKLIALVTGFSGNLYCFVLLVFHLVLTGACISVFKRIPFLRAL